MDFAHVMNGYRYHTKYDHIDYIPMGVLQRTGDNILNLVKIIANSDELANTKVRLRIKNCGRINNICYVRVSPRIVRYILIYLDYILFPIVKTLALFSTLLWLFCPF